MIIVVLTFFIRSSEWPAVARKEIPPPPKVTFEKEVVITV
jgi:hypothetical protein